MKKILKCTLCIVLICACLIPNLTLHVEAGDIIDELFGISFYNFYYLDENGREKSDGFYNWGSDDEKEHGIYISKTGLETIKVVIKAGNNEIYNKCQPVLLWMHKGDGLFDTTKWTDIDIWYKNKLEETFLLCEIPDYSKDTEIEIHVPLKLNIGATGLINGGYYEIEFYGEGAIPQELMFAYKAQTYTLEELENYIQYQMADNIDEYYNVDSGFRSEKDGFTFCNSDFIDIENGGVCAGIAAVTTAKYNGYNLASQYSYEKTRYTPSSEYTWYNSIYGGGSIRDLVLNDTNILHNNSPSYNMTGTTIAKCYPNAGFLYNDENDMAFYSLLKYYLQKNNLVTLAKGNSYVGSIRLSNLENRWSIIDYVASYMRQGKAVTVNICTPGGGHAIVGYRIEKIDADTYRMYCYDSNYPDDMGRYYAEGAPQNYYLSDDGSYQNIVWKKREVYIDFTKRTITGYTGPTSVAEYDVFDFDSSHTSIQTSSSQGGTIAFSLCKGDDVGVFNYGSESNEVVAYKAYPVIQSDGSVFIRTFAFYKSGEVCEVTNSANTTVKMDFNFVGWYKVKNSTLTMTKNGYVFANQGSRYVECYVTYNNHKGSFGEIKVRIPVVEK